MQSLQLRVEVSDQKVQRNNFPGMHSDVHQIQMYPENVIPLNSLINL